jgi:hypothetical protein
MSPRAPICFSCGQPIPASQTWAPSASALGSPAEMPRLNRTPDGNPCDACAERLLEAMPSLITGVRSAGDSAEELPQEGGISREAEADDFPSAG